MAGRGGLPEARRIQSKDGKAGRDADKPYTLNRLKLIGWIGWLVELVG